SLITSFIFFFLSFFFSCSVHHLDLLSFPTRRSSDLERETFLTHYHKRSNAESTFSMMKRKFGDSLRSRTDTAMINEALCKVLCQDRKSTRLNSSHVEISYAVFCLKKKKKKKSHNVYI